MAERFKAIIRKEREQLTRERQGLEARLAEIDQELQAIDAYENAKANRPGKSRRATPSRQQSRARPVRTAKGRSSKREALLQVIRDNPGLRRREILSRMGVKGNKSGETAISNALTALTKTHQLSRIEGKYVPAEVGK